MVQQRVLATVNGKFVIQATQAAREFLLREGTDLKYGARHLKRAIEKFVVYPIATLISTSQVESGEILCLDWDGVDSNLSFSKEVVATQSL
jgi:ATP-dependent Clp protease ATP-binding subunit ClpA